MNTVAGVEDGIILEIIDGKDVGEGPIFTGATVVGSVVGANDGKTTGLSDSGFAVVGGRDGEDDFKTVGDKDGSGVIVVFMLTGKKV
jgi:hypothetical protein